MRFGKAAALVAAGVALAVGLTACGPAIIRVEEPTRHETKTVSRRSAEAVDARLEIGVGELNVSGGATSAMDATFDYSPESWKPEMSESVQGTTAVVSVAQPSTRTLLGTSARNRWDVRFNDELPLRLAVQTGVGKSVLDLSTLAVGRLSVQGGVGDTRIELGSRVASDTAVQVQGGVGSLTLIVPAGTGVRVSGYQDGVGRFSAEGFTSRPGENALVNADYGRPGVKTIDVSVQRGVGDVTIEQR